MASLVLYASLLASIAVAQTGWQSSWQPTCTNLTIPVSISARNGYFPESVNPTTDIEVTNFVLDLTRQGTNYTQSVLAGVWK